MSDNSTDGPVADRGADATGESPDRTTYPRNTATGTDREFDWRGWTLVAAIVVSFLVAPGLLYFLPAASQGVGMLGLDWRTTYLVLPLVPALLLGTIAVWSAVRSRD